MEVKRSPLVLLICDSNNFSIVRCLENAFYNKVNLVTVHLDIEEWLPKSEVLEKLYYRFFKLRLKRVAGLPHEPDLVLVVEPNVKLRLDLSRFRNSVTAFYAVDPHSATGEEGYRQCRVDQYDYVFSGQKDYIAMLSGLGCKKVSWLPYAVDTIVFRENASVTPYDVVFLGSMMGNRKEVLTRLRRRFKLLTAVHGAGAYYMHDAATAYSMSKTVLQISNRSTLGARIFEGMACNRLVIADRIRNGLTDLFRDGKEIVLYGDFDELEEKVGYYLRNEAKRTEIAERGSELVKARHTYAQRVEQVLKTTLEGG